MTSTALPSTDSGYEPYTPGVLKVYDLLVHGLSNPLLWRCPTSVLRSQYNTLVDAVHLDVGPGTGYFLDHCTLPGEQPRVTLVDANHHVLEYASRRLARYKPTALQANILRPLPLTPGQFGSIALSYVLHCLPGTMATKRTVLRSLAPLLRPGGVLFGSTILGASRAHTRRSKAVLRLYNRRGVFANIHDDLDGLEAALAAEFPRHDIEVHGTVALFAGWES